MLAAALHCHLRPMRPEDIPQVLDIERQSFPTMWPQTTYQRELDNNLARYLVLCDVPADGARSEPPQPASGIRRAVRRFFGGLPAASRERVLGMVGLWYLIDEAHIVTIAVRPELRRQGIGEVLLVAALEAACEASQEKMTLEYRISNTTARSLYEKYGLRQVGVRAKYYSDNQEDAVLMTTPPLRSADFRALIKERVAEQRRRWGENYPLEGHLKAFDGTG
jgi:ribosomal-protein-alanine N-acetyltransferase